MSVRESSKGGLASTEPEMINERSKRQSLGISLHWKNAGVRGDLSGLYSSSPVGPLRKLRLSKVESSSKAVDQGGHIVWPHWLIPHPGIVIYSRPVL